MDTVRRIRTSKPGVVFVKPAHKIVWRGYLKPKDQREYLGGIDKRTHRKWREMDTWREVQVGKIALAKVQWLDDFVLSFEDQKLERQAEEMARSVIGCPRRTFCHQPAG